MYSLCLGHFKTAGLLELIHVSKPCEYWGRAATDNFWAPPPPTFVDRLVVAAAEKFSACRRCHCCCVLILLQFSMTKKGHYTSSFVSLYHTLTDFIIIILTFV